MVFYTHDEIPEPLAARCSRPATRTPIPTSSCPSGSPALRAQLERYVEVGFSKLVLVPAHEPESWDDELGSVSREILPLQR